MDPAYRAKQERAIESRLRTVFARQRERIMDGGASSGWADFAQEFRDAIAAKLQETYENAAMLALLLIAAGSTAAQDWLKLNPYQAESDYGTRRADELAKDIRDRVRGEAAELRKSGELTPGNLATRLGPKQAEAIAITETTSANSKGESAAKKEAERKMPDVEKVIEVWQTEQDAKVCPICRPLHGTTWRVWAERFPSGPPAHPNCRCEKVQRVTYSKQKQGGVT